MDLSIQIGRINLKNPVISASGTFGYGTEFIDILDISKLGAISVKGLHIDPQGGNPPIRIVETPCGMLNSIGLQGIGIDSFEKDKMPILRGYDVPIIVNFWGRSNYEYEKACERLNAISGISGLELNVSCPNIKAGGMSFGTDPEVLSGLVRSIRKMTNLTLIVKLSPNVTSISEMAKIAEYEGADALSLINTISAMAIDIENRKPILANKIGGLSGPAIRPIALRMVWEAVNSVKIPVIGIGGIMNGNDAMEFIIAGASAIQVGTANFINPLSSIQIIEDIKQYCIKHSFNDIKSLIGSLIT